MILFINYSGHILQLLGMIFFLPLGIILAIRTLRAYKIISFYKNKIQVRYPFRLKTIMLKTREISYWKEERVKTLNKEFKEATIDSPQAKLKFSNQEFTNYPRAISFLQKNAGKKQQKVS